MDEAFECIYLYITHCVYLHYTVCYIIEIYIFIYFIFLSIKIKKNIGKIAII